MDVVDATEYGECFMKCAELKNGNSNFQVCTGPRRTVCSSGLFFLSV